MQDNEPVTVAADFARRALRAVPQSPPERWPLPPLELLPIAVALQLDARVVTSAATTRRRTSRSRRAT